MNQWRKQEMPLQFDTPAARPYPSAQGRAHNEEDAAGWVAGSPSLRPSAFAADAAAGAPRYLRQPQVSDSDQAPAVEIRQYQGENLSSIKDFRENSIQGPQIVDIADYTLAIHGLVDKDLSYTYNDILNSFEPHKKVITISCVEGWDVTLLWEGVTTL